MFDLYKLLSTKKVYSLIITIVIFAFLYLLLDDTSFSGVNFIKDKIKQEVIKKKISKEIDTTTSLETFKLYSETDATIEDATKNVAEETKEIDIIPEKINVPLPQRFFDRLYFSIVTSCLIGYGDIYPKSNAAKSLSMVQSFITLALIIQ